MFAEFLRHMFLVMASALGLVGIPLPLPLPPLPEDPALLRAAPQGSLLYVQWFGAGTPAANPGNRSERLAAEQEVRVMVDTLMAATRSMLEAEVGKAPQATQALSAFDLLVAALQRPGCAFLIDLQPLAAGLVVQFGDAAVAADATVAAAFTALTGQAELSTEDIAGVPFRGVTIGDGPFVGTAAVEGYLCVAVGKDAAAQMVAGLRNQDQGLAGHPALAPLRAGTKVERPVLRTWAALDTLAAKAPFASRFWGPLGVDKVHAAFAESGLEGDGFVSRLQLAVPKPTGLLVELGARPLSQDDLVLVPADATIAFALRGSDGGFENLLLGVLGALSGQPPERDWLQFQEQVQRTAGVQVRDDLLKNVGDCVVAWSAPSQGGIGFTGAVAAVPLRDGETFTRNLTAMWEKMTDVAPNKARERAENRRIGHRAYLEQFEHGGTRVWWVDLIDRDMPFAFSWTATSNHFLFGLLPQPVRCAIDASREPNFDRALARSPLIARRGPAAAMLYLDLAGLLQQAYAPGLMLLEIVSMAWQRDGFDFDLADVPRLQVLRPHLGQELTVLEAVPGGFRLVRRGSLPVFDPLLITCVAACLLAAD